MVHLVQNVHLNVTCTHVLAHVVSNVLPNVICTHHSIQWYRSLHCVARCPCRRQQHESNLLKRTASEDWCDGWPPHNQALPSTPQVQGCQSVNQGIMQQRRSKTSTACDIIMLDKQCLNYGYRTNILTMQCQCSKGKVMTSLLTLGSIVPANKRCKVCFGKKLICWKVSFFSSCMSGNKQFALKIK